MTGAVSLRAGPRQLILTGGEELRWHAFGPPLPDADTAPVLQRRPVPNASLDSPPPLPLCPVEGWGFWGTPGLACAGRPPIQWQNATLTQTDATAQVTLVAAGLRWEQTLTLAESGGLTVSVRVTNEGSAPLTLLRCCAVTLPLPSDATEILTFSGTWCNEFQTPRLTLPAGSFERTSRRGRPGHDGFPAIVCGAPGFSDQKGWITAAHLAWSGDHSLRIDALPDGQRLMQLGEAFAGGALTLAVGETYYSPEAVIFTADGLNDLRRQTHTHTRTHILPAQTRPRPVHLNTWEALYFNHDRAALSALIAAAADVGVERFVLDDGWFRGRRSDRAGLGDWTPDAALYPHGLGPIAAEIQAAGMAMGLWVEPEMVNPDSDLYRTHPDWCLHVPGAAQPTARHQLGLDLTRPEVIEYLFAHLDRLLRETPIAYLKWDMNRDLAPAYSPVNGWVTPAQTRALYGLIDRLRAAHPAVEIESCASGGARADWGILRRTDRVWTSDSNDARDRADIQRGFSLFFPPEVMGSHIGPAECHTSGRRLPLQTRGAVALAGHMGIEWDIRGLGPEERATLAALIAHFKADRSLQQRAETHFLPLPDARAIGWMLLDPQTGAARVTIISRSYSQVPLTVKLPGLPAGAFYHLSTQAPFAVPEGLAGQNFSAEALQHIGLLLDLRAPDQALIFALEPQS